MKLPATHRTPADAPDRRGSALIIVMLLLVILFLLGTALVGTTQEDRVSSYQNTENAQVDMYLDGVINMAKATLIGDLFGTGSDRLKSEFRPAGYGHLVTSSVSNNKWLAARVPELRDNDSTGRNPYGVYAKYNWPFTSLPVHLNDEPQFGWTPFLSPFDPRGGAYRVNNPAMFLEINGEDYPGFHRGNADPVVAADADGDGIADSGYWSINKQPRNGIHYFAALRIIDNAAGLNVNTAWRRDFDLDLSGSRIPNPAIVPSNVGLREAFPANADYDADEEMAALNDYRFGGVSEPDMKPFLDDGRQRPDARWSTHAEAFYQGLGFRMGNPARSDPDSYYRPLTSLDDTSLAYRFVLGNPDAAMSPLESVLRNSLRAPNFDNDHSRIWKQYQRRRSASGAYADTHLHVLDRWHENFDYDGGRYSMRPLLMTSNPTSQSVPVPRRDIDGDREREEPGNVGMLHYHTRGEWSANPRPNYEIHDLVRFKGRYYAKVAAGNEEPTGNEMANGAWEYQPWTETPQKACLNTGSFRELWRAYWAAMLTTSGGGDGLPSNRETFHALMRRSPVRDKSHELIGEQVAQLRAALAAVNTMGMRNESNNVFSRTITLYEPKPTGTIGGSGGASPPPPVGPGRKTYAEIDNPKYVVSVFSHEQDPIISEVLVDRDYVALELHNPWPREVQLRNWHLAHLQGLGSPGNGPDGAPLPAPAGKKRLVKVAALSPTVLEMKEYEYLVFESDEAERPPELTKRFEQRGIKPIVVPGLKNAIGAECVLLRPRKQGGDLTAGASPTNRYNEGSATQPNLADWVPVDQIDIPGRRGAYRYARDTTRGEWKFFFPGGYDIDGSPSRYDGFKRGDAADSHLGEGGTATYSDTLRLKLHAPEWAVNRLGGSLHNRYPFGGFARAGEVIRVPFIGRYTIRLHGDDPDTVLEMHSITTDIEYSWAEGTEPHKRPVTAGRLITPDSSLARQYHWRTSLVEYFTTRVAHHDYLPNVLPDEYGTYDDEGNLIRLDRPDPVANTHPAKANVGEPLVGVQGLVNINSAPWIVLNQLPLWVHADGTIDEENNKFLAKQLAKVNHNGRWPVSDSLIELNDHIWYLMTSPNYGSRARLPPPEDWEAYYAPMIRLSNLVGVRSDSFTVYVLVEGWRDAFTPSARRVLQRRAAFMADRSNVTPTHRQMRIVNIPTN